MATASEEHHELPLPVELPLDEYTSTADVSLKTQMIRFGVTGGLSAIVDFGSLLAFLGLGLPFWLAKSISFILGTTTAYMINRRWTFKAPHSNARFMAVIALYGVTFALQVGISTALYHYFPEDALWRVPVAFVIAQGTATVINFIVQRAVIFKIS
ncbi:GtrA family protein [Hoyosella altamirensis]|uniref:Putative flippase GtrA n=1 Tax=Hoyosella altamirensis TaxID=616997 RepID=A0A839RPJ9_9ACTN|nr:GtrA family protein [Hoyosella altamirensis]MBB3037956.1 putative flippase GtrA [Hoyosella altamirensis]